MRRIMKKPVDQRAADEIELLYRELHELKFLKEKQALTKADISDLAQLFTFESFKAMQSSIQLGEKVPENDQKFYIIIKGVVSYKVKNPCIKHWNSRWKEYQELLIWKKKVLDPKIRRAKMQNQDSYVDKIRVK